MLIACHQPNFIPPFPYFVKMALCDKFIVMDCVKFSKSNYQNWQTIFGKRWCVPVCHGEVPIIEKRYTTGKSLAEVNLYWIMAIAETLGIDTEKMDGDFPSELTKTERIIELVKRYKGDGYIANASAPEKYLDVGLLAHHGIEFIPLVCEEKRNVLELFNDIGIEKTIELLERTVAKNKEAIQWKQSMSNGR